MKEITIHCRMAYPGHVAGKALVSHDSLGAWGAINPTTGVVTERDHPLHGQCIKDTILVFPSAKGSSAWGKTFQNIGYNKVAPKAMLVGKIDPRSALGAVTSHTTTATDFDVDPLTVIETGDWVDVDADHGIITVTKE